MMLYSKYVVVGVAVVVVVAVNVRDLRV